MVVRYGRILTIMTSPLDATATNTEHGNFFQVHEEVPTIAPPILGDVGIFSIATSTITTLLILAIFIVLCRFVMKSKLVPTTFQHLVELFYEIVLSFITVIIGTKEKAAKVVPYVGAVMMYLLIANLLPLIPPVASFYITIEGDHVPLFRGVTTDFSTTFGLAFAVIVIMQIVGMREQGTGKYLSHFIQIKQVIQGFRKGIGEGSVAIVSFLVGIIEIISEFAKVLSLSLRLFGNMFAHEVLTVILLGAFAFGVPAIWMGMGVLVGVVQSVVFVALITVYYSLVIKKEGKDSH